MLLLACFHFFVSLSLGFRSSLESVRVNIVSLALHNMQMTPRIIVRRARAGELAGRRCVSVVVAVVWKSYNERADESRNASWNFVEKSVAKGVRLIIVSANLLIFKSKDRYCLFFVLFIFYLYEVWPMAGNTGKMPKECHYIAFICLERRSATRCDCSRAFVKWMPHRMSRWMW